MVKFGETNSYGAIESKGYVGIIYDAVQIR